MNMPDKTVKESCYRREDCRLCGGTKLDAVLHLAETPLADAYAPADHLDGTSETFPLDLSLCRGCGHTQLDHVVDPDALYGEFRYETSRSPGLSEHFHENVVQILDQVKPQAGALVVDVGSNDGTALRFFKDQGMTVLGVDPARDIAQRATESGVETIPDYLTVDLAQRIKEERGPAAIVTSNNTMANVDDLDAYGEAIRTILAPDGVFVFETGYLLDLIQNLVFDNVYHEHISYFSVKPLEGFFRRHQMELIDARRVQTKGGSLRAAVQLKGGHRPVNPSVQKMVDEETRCGLHNAGKYKDFSSVIDGAKAQLNELLGRLVKQGEIIAGYGASHSVTTFIYHFGIADKLSFLVDDNPLKHDLFSPGWHIPVLSPEAIYEKNPGYVVILPWRFSQTIIEKHQAYLDQGGHFILPLPRLEIV